MLGLFLLRLCKVFLPFLQEGEVTGLYLLLKRELIKRNGYKLFLPLVCILREQIFIHFLLEVRPSCGGVIGRKIDENIVVIILVPVSAADIELRVDEHDLLELMELHYNLRALDQYFPQCLEELSFFLAAMGLDVE